MLSFYGGVYSSTVGFTLAFGEDAKELVGLCGLYIGSGEVFGGCIFGLLGRKLVHYGRSPIVIAGYLVHVFALVLIAMNLPSEASLGPTTNTSVFNPPLQWIALSCAFLLGLGDACFNTQIFSMLGGDFASKSAAAFAIYWFGQSIGSTIAFIYSTYWGLGISICILIVVATIGTISFVSVENSNKKIISDKTLDKQESLMTMTGI